jgi:hypothetical protein
MGIVGVITLEVFEDGELVDRRECHNLITLGGFGAFASALNWSGIEDQAANLGLNTPYFLAPIYGAVGIGTGTLSQSDTALYNELARSTVSQATGVSGQLSWSFFFGLTQAVGTVSEAGVFGGAGSASASGILLDHVLISPAVVKTSSQTMTMQVTFTLVNG